MKSIARYLALSVVSMSILCGVSVQCDASEHALLMPNYKLVQSYLNSISPNNGPYFLFACMPSQAQYTIVIPYGETKGVLIVYALGQILKANTLTYNFKTKVWNIGLLPENKSFYVHDRDLQQILASDATVKAEVSKILANEPRFYLVNKATVVSLSILANYPHIKSVSCPGN